MVASQADETDEQRAERLEQAAEQAECNSGTLYLVEQDLRGLARHAAAENPETLSQVKSLGAMYGAPDDALSVDTAASLLGQKVTARPDLVALTVKTLNESFERRGLYDELGTEPELQPPLTEGEE
jgi:hypothetical protein